MAPPGARLTMCRGPGSRVRNGTRLARAVTVPSGTSTRGASLANTVLPAAGPAPLSKSTVTPASSEAEL